MFIFEETNDVKAFELPMGYCCYAGVVLLVRKFSHYVDAVFVLGDGRVCLGSYTVTFTLYSLSAFITKAYGYFPSHHSR